MARRRKPNVYDIMDDKIEKAVLADGQKKVYVTNSTYESDEDDEPIDNLDNIAAEGKIVLVAERDEFWGGKRSRHYVSKPLENPTWLQVAVCANRMIKRVRDAHHVFLEGIGEIKLSEIGSDDLKQKVKELQAKGYKVCEFYMGS